MATKGSNHIGTPTHRSGATSTEENVLLSRLAQGDRTAFWEIWEYYQTPLLFRLCLRWMDGNREDAEDALSSARLNAWRYLAAHPDEIVNLKAWLTRVLYNHCMNMRKDNQRSQHYISPILPADYMTSRSAGPVQAPPEEAILQHEMRMYVRSNINRLPPPLREPLVLYVFSNMAQRDIATHLSLSYDAVRKRLQNARAILHKQMTPYLERGDRGSVWTSLGGADDMASRPTPVHEAVTSPVVAIRLVRITLPNGVEQYVPLALDHQPTRQQQKLAALRTYVQQHPGGWRKHVQLADLLYTMGHWEDAISIFHHVLRRQPFYLQARLRLGQMLRLLQRENEAIKVYANALAWTDRAATQHYLHGCMDICNRHLEKAVQSYTAAADLDPGNALYRRELGLTWLRAGHPEEALQAFDLVLADHPDDLVALTFSYAPLMAAGREEDAQWRMERAWQLDAENALALAQLIDSRCRRGQVWGDAGRRTKALLACALQLSHESPHVQAAQAHYHIARGEPHKGLALSDLRRRSPEQDLALEDRKCLP